MNVWHEIAKEGKPNKPGRYWVYADSYHSFARTYDIERGADFDDCITHWTELPPNPTPGPVAKQATGEPSEAWNLRVELARVQRQNSALREAAKDLIDSTVKFTHSEAAEFHGRDADLAVVNLDALNALDRALEMLDESSLPALLREIWVNDSNGLRNGGRYYLTEKDALFNPEPHGKQICFREVPKAP